MTTKHSGEQTKKNKDASRGPSLWAYLLSGSVQNQFKNSFYKSTSFGVINPSNNHVAQFYEFFLSSYCCVGSDI